MRSRKLSLFPLVMMVFILLLGSFGCVTRRQPDGSVVTRWLPSKVQLPPAGEGPSVHYMAQSPSSLIPGQPRPQPVLKELGENGTVEQIGVVDNYFPFEITYLTSMVSVCYGSENRIEQPASNDPCWLPVGAVEDVTLRRRSPGPWIKLYTTGGSFQFIAHKAGPHGMTIEYAGSQDIDWYGRDHVCPGNRVVDFAFVFGYFPEQHDNVPYCRDIS